MIDTSLEHMVSSTSSNGAQRRRNHIDPDLGVRPRGDRRPQRSRRIHRRSGRLPATILSGNLISSLLDPSRNNERSDMILNRSRICRCVKRTYPEMRALIITAAPAPTATISFTCRWNRDYIGGSTSANLFGRIQQFLIMYVCIDQENNHYCFGVGGKSGDDEEDDEGGDELDPKRVRSADARHGGDGGA